MLKSNAVLLQRWISYSFSGDNKKYSNFHLQYKLSIKLRFLILFWNNESYYFWKLTNNFLGESDVAHPKESCQSLSPIFGMFLVSKETLLTTLLFKMSRPSSTHQGPTVLCTTSRPRCKSSSLASIKVPVWPLWRSLLTKDTSLLLRREKKRPSRSMTYRHSERRRFWLQLKCSPSSMSAWLSPLIPSILYPKVLDLTGLFFTGLGRNQNPWLQFELQQMLATKFTRLVSNASSSFSTSNIIEILISTYNNPIPNAISAKVRRILQPSC